MGYRSIIIRPIAHTIVRKARKKHKRALNNQDYTLSYLIQRARNTQFGKDHGFANIRNYEQFKAAVPVRDYEGLRQYVDQIVEGRPNILWPGKPKYFAKTSGTTSGVKYIPITKDSMAHHIEAARDALFCHCTDDGQFDFFDGKMLYLSGSPALNNKNGIAVGRLSGIVNHEIPNWIKGNKLPSDKANYIEEWADKVQTIVKETVGQDLRLIGGIPPWVIMFFEEILNHTTKSKVIEVFPNLSMYVYGGVNYEPYRSTIERLIGKSISAIETYPASEGFIAYQDRAHNDGLLLNTDAGMFFEFVPADEIFNQQPTRLKLSQVEIGKNYALIINSNAGLWGYNIGDTVQFVSLDPYKLLVSGRVKHFISAFGEHVIGKEVDQAMQEACASTGAEIQDFTVAPQVNPNAGEKPYHEWFVAFKKQPDQLRIFQDLLEQSMTEQNIYYQDLIVGNILQPLKVRSLHADAFQQYMASIGKLGGQNKLPRLSNDRKIADALLKYVQ